MYTSALVILHLVYFAVFSTITFLPKYFGELGLTDGQIGMLMSLPAIAGVLLQPFFGALTDRVRLKKFVVIGLLIGLSAVCFWLNVQTSLVMLFVGMLVFYILQLPIAPAFLSISLEYMHGIGRDYGPVRLVGSVGYQLGALAVGGLFVASLHGIYAFLGWIMLATCAAACFLPPVAGHQHGRDRVRMRELLADKHVMALLGMVLVGTTTSAFYMSFFSKHLGDLGMDNTLTGVMLVVSVLAEIPFLIFSGRLWRRLSVWRWIQIGYVLNAVRWIGLAVFRQAGWILLFQSLAVSVMACFEFFPTLYINQRAQDSLKGSAQMMLAIVSFGIAKVIGSLLGGFVSDLVGIPAVFAFNGALLLAAFVATLRPVRRLIREDAESDAAS